MDQLSKRIGAPELPVLQPVSKSEGYATYCVRSKKAYRLVRRAVYDEAQPLLKAAVMEELFSH